MGASLDRVRSCNRWALVTVLRIHRRAERSWRLRLFRDCLRKNKYAMLSFDGGNGDEKSALREDCMCLQAQQLPACGW